MYDPKDTITPLWENRTLYPLAVSSPYFCSGTIVKFVICGHADICGVIINYSSDPYSAEPPVRAMKLMDFPLVRNIGGIHIFFGFNSAIILDSQLETYLIRYSWPDNDNSVIPASSLRIERTLEECRLGILLDVESGRVVACGAAEQDPQLHHIVWDFSVIYKSES